MTLPLLAWRNLWRNPPRTILTVASLAFSLFLFSMLSATVDSMCAVSVESAKRLRLVVHHKTTVTKLLPLSHAGRIAAIPGVRAVCGMRWFGGRPIESQEQFPSMAVDHAAVPIAFDDLELAAPEWASWSAEKTAAIVGQGLADRMGWKRGDRATLKGTVPPYLSLEFHIVAITSAPAYPNVFIFRFDYLHDVLRADPMMPVEHDDATNLYWVKVDSHRVIERVRQAIDAACATTGDPTRTEMEEVFVTQFTKMFGDIPGILRQVGLIVLVSILLVVFNTISTSVRERVGELAVLKAIGFTPGRLFGTVVGESVLMGLMGGILGVLPALGAFGFFSGAGLNMPYFPVIIVSTPVALGGIAASALIGLTAALPAAQRAARLSVVTALRDLE